MFCLVDYFSLVCLLFYFYFLLFVFVVLLLLFSCSLLLLFLFYFFFIFFDPLENHSEQIMRGLVPLKLPCRTLTRISEQNNMP